ncbi:MAG: relaxase/mobilization nuclease domain-containing protein [Olegusella sp.]|nr:relaxase/mobilization nuclease domain-containing protein [Olegusella sp.]MEE1274445.1 relaxase/mobilization nuclease domain-containing protein [Olegusella sp.]
MPALKPISGKGSCRTIIRYLTRSGRAVAADFINCTERDSSGRTVWQQMDAEREAYGNDLPDTRGREARTYEHFVLSPDPRDRVDLATLRDLATEWAARYFGEYQVAIYYHDDNAQHIPHAHLVVNNTNLVTYKRLSPTLTREFEEEIFKGLQQMARERGLHAFNTDMEAEEKQTRAAEARETVQRDYRVKAVGEIETDGRFSWLEDVRARVQCAIKLSRDEKGFLRECGLLGLDVRANKRGEYVFTHPGGEHWQVSGPHLGRDWTRWAIGSRLAASRPPTGERLAAIESAIAELSWDRGTPEVLGTTRDRRVTAAAVAEMLDVAESRDLASMDDFARAMSEPMSRADRDALRRAAHTAKALGCYPRERPRDAGERVRDVALRDIKQTVRPQTDETLGNTPSIGVAREERQT